MKLDRLLYIVIALLNKDQVTAVELAKYFEVSVRTIYRDIEALNMAGIPVYSQQGTGGGFSMLDNYKMDKQFLKDEEISSIITALKGMSTTIDDIKLDGIVEKLKALGSDTKEGSSKDLILDFTPWGSTKKQKEKLSTIKKAIEEIKVISFKYTNNSSESAQRFVEPVKLIYKGYSWYLYAYCRTREDIRVFKLSRIINLEILEEVFLPREIHDSSYETSLDIDKLGTNTKMIKITMKFTPNMRAKVQDYFDESNIEYLDNGSMRVEILNPDNEWTYGFILSFGADVEVLEPKYLRDIIKEKSLRIYNLYKQT
jgi:predicted DNA-binding transcriptional regulator YafY